MNNLNVNRQDSIAIIGAGPAGIHLAHLLKKNGFENITIFEESDRIGGKSFSIEKEGVANEMGTCYLSANYNKVIDLIKTYELSTLVDAWPIHRSSINNDGSRINISDWVSEEIVRLSLPDILKKFPQIIPNKLIYISLINSIKKYNRIYKRLYQKNSEYIVPQDILDKNIDIISQPMNKYFLKHHISSLEPIFLLSATLMCYGYSDNIPAYYGLYWMNDVYLDAYLKNLFLKDKISTVIMVKDGFQNVWKKLANKFNLNIKLNTKISAINRNLSESKGKISIQYRQDQKGMVTENKFDWLISAIQGENMLSLLENPTESEKDIFKHQVYSHVVTRLLLVKNPNAKDAIVYKLNNLSHENENKIFAYRNAAPILANVNDNLQYFVTYQYYEYEKNFNKKLCDSNFFSFLKEQNMQLIDIIEEQNWRYFPRFDSAEIYNKLPWKTLSIQGENNTFYAGSSVSFESVNAVVNFNHYLMEKHFNLMTH